MNPSIRRTRFLNPFNADAKVLMIHLRSQRILVLCEKMMKLVLTYRELFQTIRQQEVDWCLFPLMSKSLTARQLLRISVVFLDHFYDTRVLIGSSVTVCRVIFSTGDHRLEESHESFRMFAVFLGVIDK